MRKKMDFKWELIDENNEGKFQTLRAQVIGGWLVQTVLQDLKLKVLTSAVTFLPDRDHEWFITKPKETEPPKPTVKAADFEPK
jgi:hypothetical protein